MINKTTLLVPLCLYSCLKPVFSVHDALFAYDLTLAQNKVK